MKQTKEEKAITLIALVITIIVLLILAGITLSLVIGENGILNRAKQAGKVYTGASIKEEIQLAITDIEMGELKNNSTRSLQDAILAELPNVLQDASLELDTSTNKLIGDYKNYIFIIDKDYNVTIEGQGKLLSIPKMTADQMEFGEAFAGSTANGRSAYEAFDKVIDPTTASGARPGYMVSSTTSNYIGFDFKQPVTVYKFAYQGHTIDANVRFTQMKLQASDDKTNWQDVSDWIHPVNSSTLGFEYFEVPNTQKHRYWRVYGENAGHSWCGVLELDFFART